MLPRIPRNLRAALLAMFVGCASFTLGAASAEPPAANHEDNAVRIDAQSGEAWHYHYGDDPNGKLGWADPSFDDRSWPIAQQASWPMPAFYSDGFMWVRTWVPVRSDATGRLAIRVSEKANLSDSFVVADEVFVNGRPVGRRGSFPPNIQLDLSGRDAVFELDPNVVLPGKMAMVALRVWYPLILRGPAYQESERFSIDEIRVLDLARRSAFLTTVLSGGPDLVLNSLIAVLGIGLLILWRWAGGRELLLCSAMLTSFPLFDAINGLEDLGLVTWPWSVDSLVWPALRMATMAVTIEFVWTIHGLRFPVVKRLGQVAMVVRNLAAPITRLAANPSLLVYWADRVRLPAGGLVDVVVLGANLWVLFTRKRNRLIAAAVALIPLTSLSEKFFNLDDGRIGPFHFDYFNLAFFVAALALFVTLVQRAWLAWRTRDELRAEFETARDMQQQLVAPAVDVPGFKIESAYLPAKLVGGDFFRVVPEDGGSVLIVVGDVSGKGLAAAMTVSAVIGALRSTPPVSPAWILNALNYGLSGQLQGGFVTCCAARITAQGMVTIANAGHISPYRNGAEVEVEAGMPLGIFPEAEYEDSQFMLKPDESLTFMTDGVVEARNASGELFGFERTLRISNSGAATIAQLAKDFGQEDDITVVSITRTAPLELALA